MTARCRGRRGVNGAQGPPGADSTVPGPTGPQGPIGPGRPNQDRPEPQALPVRTEQGAPGTAPPIMDSVATVGTSLLFSRQDHIHPSDTVARAFHHGWHDGAVPARRQVMANTG